MTNTMVTDFMSSMDWNGSIVPYSEERATMSDSRQELYNNLRDRVVRLVAHYTMDEADEVFVYAVDNQLELSECMGTDTGVLGYSVMDEYYPIED